jgi:signal transduction histidine kinase
MRLARKLMLGLVITMLVVFAVRATVRVRDEISRSRADLRDEQRLVLRALRPAVAQVWRAEGRERALALLGYADVNLDRMDVRWVSQDPALGPGWRPRAAIDLASLRGGEERTVLRQGESGDHVTTYVAASHDGSVPGALEISESLERSRQALREKVLEVLITTALAAASSIVVVSALGFFLVGRPMRRLADAARRIGTGDLDARLEIAQRDEIGELAREMNQMCDRLRGAQDRISTETAARINALEQLRHADRLNTVGKLASGIAHELGTPLNVVAGRAKMIANGDVEGTAARDSARTVLEQAERMTKIIRQLLDFARRRGAQKAPCDLADTGRKTVALLGPLAARAAVRLEVREEGAPLVVAADHAQLQQALMNLIVNGIQATSNGGVITLELGAAEATPPADHEAAFGRYAFIRVRDQGVGIPAEALSRVFEPFFTTKGVGEGTGLGLSVAYGIVRDHGGWIGIESEVGAGSCFTIFLPLGDAKGAAA